MEEQSPRVCPFCEGEVSPTAKKCLHCGEWLSESGRSRTSEQGGSRASTWIVGGLVIIALLVAIPLVVYGTASPCGMLKKEILRRAWAKSSLGTGDEWETAGEAIGLALSSNLIDQFVDALSPPRCLIAWGNLVTGGELQGVRGFGSDRYEVSMKSDLRNLAAAQEAYFADNLTYSTNSWNLDFTPSSGVYIEVVSADREGWGAIARHELTDAECALFYGSTSHRHSPAEFEAVVECE